jgi:hypothetical protein
MKISNFGNRRKCVRRYKDHFGKGVNEVYGKKK